MLMFIWQRDFGDRYPKLREAYQALKAQNVITEDPVIQDDSESVRWALWISTNFHFATELAKNGQ